MEDAMKTSLIGAKEQDVDLDVDAVAKKMTFSIGKVVAKYFKDPRVMAQGTDSQAKELIECLVGDAMEGLKTACKEAPWFVQGDLSAPLLLAVHHTLKGAKVLSRTLGPDLEQHVQT